MATKTGIINEALIELGASRIISDTDGTKNANAANDVYDAVLERCLRIHYWNFAKTKLKLSRLTNTPAFGFDFIYAKPSDWLRTKSIHDNDGGLGTVPYSLEAEGFHADALDIYLVYTKLVTDPNQMTADFRHYLAMSLAKTIAKKITGEDDDREAMRSLESSALSVAQSADAIEDFPEQQPEGSWVLDRAL
tara:strand:+ start:242 stop:817 length:576 start_codon:yes stop_codon:yes gene_type:complete